MDSAYSDSTRFDALAPLRIWRLRIHEPAGKLILNLHWLGLMQQKGLSSFRGEMDNLGVIVSKKLYADTYLLEGSP